jgi:nitrite reductase (NO-forming)
MDRALPVLQPPRPTGRDADRTVALAAIALAAGFVAAGIVVLLAGAPPSPMSWRVIHLVLAGGASTAIAGLLPFFASALSAAPAADVRLRAGSVTLVAGGAAAVATWGTGAPGWIATAGGAAFLAGMAGTALALTSAGRGRLVRRRAVITTGYGLALGSVTAGAAIGWLGVMGWTPALLAWTYLRPAHAWLNVVGFVSVVVVATLLHLLPTVVGGRIVERVTGRIAVGGIGGGALLIGGSHVAAAIWAGPAATGPGAADPGATGLGATDPGAALAAVASLVARIGGALVLVGAAALVVETVLVLRARGRWTTEAAWHLVVTGSLVAGVGWFALGIGLAAGRVLLVGTSPDAWSTPELAAPLVLGWVVQVLIGSWTHLLPAVGPGGPAGHAARRATLARLAVPRLVAWNAGVAILALGAFADLPPAATWVGVILLGGSLGVSVALVAVALLRRRPAPPPPAPRSASHAPTPRTPGSPPRA